MVMEVVYLVSIRKTENTFIIHPETTEYKNALKAFVKALNIKFEISNEKSYHPDFVAKIQESRTQVKEGKTVKLDLDDIMKEC